MIDLNEKPLCTIPRIMCWAVDNMELLKSQPNESVDLIYSDILYRQIGISAMLFRMKLKNINRNRFTIDELKKLDDVRTRLYDSL
jgi:hypothetical protein